MIKCGHTFYFWGLIYKCVANTSGGNEAYKVLAFKLCNINQVVGQSSFKLCGYLTHLLLVYCLIIWFLTNPTWHTDWIHWQSWLILNMDISSLSNSNQQTGHAGLSKNKQLNIVILFISVAFPSQLQPKQYINRGNISSSHLATLYAG